MHCVVLVVLRSDVKQSRYNDRMRDLTPVFVALFLALFTQPRLCLMLLTLGCNVAATSRHATRVYMEVGCAGWTPGSKSGFSLHCLHRGLGVGTYCVYICFPAIRVRIGVYGFKVDDNLFLRFRFQLSFFAARFPFNIKQIIFASLSIISEVVVSPRDLSSSPSERLQLLHLASILYSRVSVQYKLFGVSITSKVDPAFSSLPFHSLLSHSLTHSVVVPRRAFWL
ncbi:hypothetical protein M422DRAFT_33264 [Sphaerobolus stellatus SS14]|uniref:Uncharacterized protein n=1 Tax=Sphaerobolus stellatus (strain SS14) TaxID=990650 RepID=A0A0C9VL29_SPHS4|nr:hypothetical protein M422DRAFT_33264 [Sphaerobolus stellatus SS14]